MQASDWLISNTTYLLFLALYAISGSMSFGFSVGDFFAVGGLIVKIVEILRDTPSEYQELIRELKRYVELQLARSLQNRSASFSARVSS